MDSIAVILLAAGSSRRMGKKNKLLLTYEGRPMIAHQIREIQKSGLENITVVLGHQAEEVKAVLPVSTSSVFNPDHLSGMTSSIQAGVAIVKAPVMGYMICLSDMPWVTTKEYCKIVDFFLEQSAANPRLIVQPVYQKQGGQPIIFSGYYRRAILAQLTPDGCREIIIENKKEVQRVEMPTAGILKDIDTPEDYQEVNNL